jgi:D-beta-D-heptose 7-phosphate kinase / D-beta-D-heptose 1-phosphate adenosyltransferase
MITHDLVKLLQSFHQKTVLVFGDVMLDRFVYGHVDRISPEAPIPIMTVQRTVDMPGGAANVARNVATLGARAILVGVVGEDSWAGDLRAQLKNFPSIEARLVADRSRPTTVKTRHVADRQQILRTDIESREPLSEDTGVLALHELIDALPASDVVIFSDYGKGVLSDSVTQAAIAAATRAGKPVLVDPKSRSLSKYRGATVLTPNRHELQLACGAECSTDEQVASGARAILEQDICSALVVTRGRDGMSIIRRDGSAIHLKTMAREVYDVSGAGDTAVATMALGVAAGEDIVETAKLANVAAGIVVGKYGTAAVTVGELIATLEQMDGGGDSPKNFTLEGVQQLARRWRDLGLSIAFTNGCFDLIHPGHVSMLGQARRNADRLIVGLNSDLSIRRLKGEGRPVQGEAARAMVLASLKSVDAVVIFEDDTPIRLIEALEPDVLVKGADYTVDTVVGADAVLGRGGKVILADIVRDESTTNMVRRAVASIQS